MSNPTLSTKLASFINGQMTGFLTEISKEYKIDESELLEKWSTFTGLKPKSKKTRDGPNIKELRLKLKSVNLPTSGKKQDLIDRLADFESGKLKPKIIDTEKAIADGDFSVMNVKMLKEKLKEKGLRTSGNKSELVERLTKSDNESDSENNSDDEDSVNYKTWTVKKLRGEMKTRGIKVKVGDKKDDMIKFLEDDDKHMDDSSDSESDSESESESESSDCETSEDEEKEEPKKKQVKNKTVKKMSAKVMINPKGGSPKVDVVEHVD